MLNAVINPVFYFRAVQFRASLIFFTLNFLGQLKVLSNILNVFKTVSPITLVVPLLKPPLTKTSNIRYKQYLYYITSGNKQDDFSCLN